MPQDFYTLKFITRELDKKLSGGKINRIIQPEKDLLIFNLYTVQGPLKLEICLSAKGCRINLTETEAPAPKVAPNFCMLLRKYLQNAEILTAGLVDGERIVFFDLKRTAEFELITTRLYVELMGKYSNAVLTENGKVLGALKCVPIGENTKRVVFAGAKYTLPERQDKTDPQDMQALEKLFDRDFADAAKFIADNVLGVAYSTALDIVETFGEKPTAGQVNRYICGGETDFCVTFAGGEPNDFKVRYAGKDKKVYPDILAAQTAYYSYFEKKRLYENLKRKVLSAVAAARKKPEKRLAAIEQKLAECRDLETLKLKGELIYANIYAVQRGAKQFEAVNYYDPDGGKIIIALDAQLTPAENAQRYFKRYEKLKRTKESVTAQRDEIAKECDYLDSVSAFLSEKILNFGGKDPIICLDERIFDLREIESELIEAGIIKEQSQKKKVATVSPFRTFAYGGFKILAGRSNVQNDRLLKSVSPQDMWLHTQGYHSSHVVIECGGKDVPDDVIKVAAEICAYYSDGRQGTKIPVDYCLKKFVKKPKKCNAGFVVYTDYKTALAEPDAHDELKGN